MLIISSETIGLKYQPLFFLKNNKNKYPEYPEYRLLTYCPAGYGLAFSLQVI